jgi:hypothetical protein
VTSDAERRIRRLVEAARRVADPFDPLGREARSVLPPCTGLSEEGVELALGRCLETSPSDAEISALCASVQPSPHAHVLLSANVFVAAHRAIALGLASSEVVSVRPSRREPEMTRLLAAGAEGLFRVEGDLTPRAGDHLWAYGEDATLRVVESGLPEGVVFHGHGSGLGVAVVDTDTPDEHLRRMALAMADDVIAFDQRGCMSLRVVLALGDEERVRGLGRELALALAEGEKRVPRGVVETTEAANAARYRDTLRFAGELLPAGSGWVGIASSESVVVPPVGRHVHVAFAADLERSARPLLGLVAALGIDGSEELGTRARRVFPGARASVLGAMQRPPFDGPVDLRGAVHASYMRDGSRPA